MDGLSALTALGGSLEVVLNGALANLDGLSALTRIGGELWIQANDALTNLDGLSSLISVGIDVIVTQNDVLGECACGLYALLEASEIPYGVAIANNATGCNSVEEIREQAPGHPDCVCTNLGSHVEVLVTDGALNEGPARALLAKLEVLLAAVVADRLSAPRILSGFIRQVEGFVHGGLLSEEQGARLIGVANILLALL